MHRKILKQRTDINLSVYACAPRSVLTPRLVKEAGSSMTSRFKECASLEKILKIPIKCLLPFLSVAFQGIGAYLRWS